MGASELPLRRIGWIISRLTTAVSVSGQIVLSARLVGPSRRLIDPAKDGRSGNRGKWLNPADQERTRRILCGWSLTITFSRSADGLGR
jgi:hypothetical protein